MSLHVFVRYSVITHITVRYVCHYTCQCQVCLSLQMPLPGVYVIIYGNVRCVGYNTSLRCIIIHVTVKYVCYCIFHYQVGPITYVTVRCIHLFVRCVFHYTCHWHVHHYICHCQMCHYHCHCVKTYDFIMTINCINVSQIHLYLFTGWSGDMSTADTGRMSR